MGKVIKHAQWLKTGRKKKSPRQARKNSRGSSPTQGGSQASNDGIAPQSKVTKQPAANTTQQKSSNVTLTPITKFCGSNDSLTSLGEEGTEQLPRRLDFEPPFGIRDNTRNQKDKKTLVFTDYESEDEPDTEDKDPNSISSASHDLEPSSKNSSKIIYVKPVKPYQPSVERSTSLGEEGDNLSLHDSDSSVSHKVDVRPSAANSSRIIYVKPVVPYQASVERSTSLGEEGDDHSLRKLPFVEKPRLAFDKQNSKETNIFDPSYNKSESGSHDKNNVSSASTPSKGLNDSVDKVPVSPAELKATSSEKNAAVAGRRKKSSIRKIAKNISERTEPIINRMQDAKILLDVNITKTTESIIQKVQDTIVAVDEKITESYEKEISRKLKKHAARIEKNKKEEKERLALWREPANESYSSVNDGDNLSAMSQYDRLYFKDLKGAINPTTVPVSERESFHGFKKAINECKPSAVQAAIRAKMIKKNRKYNIYRRDIGYYDDGITLRVGSYPYETVDEQKMKKKNQNILRYAWKGKDSDLYKELLWHYNDIDFQDKAGRTAMHFAASMACVPCIETLCGSLKLPNLNLQDDEGKTPLRKAVEVEGIKALEAIELLLEKGADPNIKANDGRTPIEYTIMEKGDEALPIIKLLFIYGEQFKERREPGRLSYLHITSLANKNVSVLETAKFLINHGVFINSTEGTGRTALIMAAMRDQVNLVKLLIQYGADTNHKDLDGRTALKYAAMRAKLGTQGAKRDTQGEKRDTQDENCLKLIKDAINANESEQMKARHHRITGKDVDDTTAKHIRVQLGMMGKNN